VANTAGEPGAKALRSSDDTLVSVGDGGVLIGRIIGLGKSVWKKPGQSGKRDQQAQALMIKGLSQTHDHH
jgi:hypothetical protein